MDKAKERKTAVLWVSPSTLTIEEGFNVREDYGDIASLAESIAENGIKVPLRVVEEKGSDLRVVIDGHRRFKAIQKLLSEGVENLFVPIMLESASGSSKEARTLSMITLNEGKPLTLLEEAEVYKRLENFGWTSEEIAQKVGKSATHIKNCFIVVSASKTLKKLITTGKVSASTVIETIKKEKSVEAAETLIEETLKTKGKVQPKDTATSKTAKPSLVKSTTEKRGNKLTQENLRGLHETLQNYEGDRVEGAFEAIEAIIKWGDGRIGNQELAQVFFKAESDE